MHSSGEVDAKEFLEGSIIANAHRDTGRVSFFFPVFFLKLKMISGLQVLIVTASVFEPILQRIEGVVNSILQGKLMSLPVKWILSSQAIAILAACSQAFSSVSNQPELKFWLQYSKFTDQGFLSSMRNS